MVTKLQYQQWAQVYFQAASTLYEIQNRKTASYIPAYYLLYHALELTLKMLIKESGHNSPENHRSHSVTNLIREYSQVFHFDTHELQAVHSLEDLNEGKGQLRYPRDILKEFYPSIFSDVANLIQHVFDERNIKEFIWYMNDLEKIRIENYGKND